MVIKMNTNFNANNEPVKENINNEEDDFLLTQQESAAVSYAMEHMDEMIEGKPTRQKELMAEKCLMTGFLNGSDWVKSITEEFINNAIEKDVKDFPDYLVPKNTEKESYIRGIKDALNSINDLFSTIYDDEDIDFDDVEGE